jgi:branched-chain amino acid aminotransferase
LTDSFWFYSGCWLSTSEPGTAPGLPLDDWGVLQGAIAVERMRTYAGKPHAMERHLQRLRNTISALGISGAEASHSFETIITEIIARNQLPQDGSADASIILLVTPGSSSQSGASRTPTVVAHLSPLPWKRIAQWWTCGQHLVVSRYQQVASECWPRSLKVRSRLNYFLADQDAHHVDVSAEALLTDRDGSVTETASGNLVLVQAGLLIAAPPETILPGVTLACFLELAQNAGWQVDRRPIFPADLFAADEVMMTGTTAALWSVVKVDNRPLKQAQPGPNLRSFQQLWSNTFRLNLGSQATLCLSAAGDAKMSRTSK